MLTDQEADEARVSAPDIVCGIGPALTTRTRSTKLTRVN